MKIFLFVQIIIWREFFSYSYFKAKALHNLHAHTNFAKKKIHAETFLFILYTVYDTVYLQALNRKRNRFLFELMLLFILIYNAFVLDSSSLFQVYMYMVLDNTCM